MSKVRVYGAICFVLLTFLLNYFDNVFPDFKEFLIFGNTYPIIDGYTSYDLIWTMIQKVNAILLCIAFLIVFPFQIIKNKIHNYIVIASLIVTIGYNLFLCIGTIHFYTHGFNKNIYYTTFTIVAISSITILFLAYKLILFFTNKQKNEVARLKSELDIRVNSLRLKEERFKKLKSTIDLKTDSIQESNFEIIKKVEALEALPLFISVYDNMEDWTINSKHKAQKIYAELDKQLQDLESIRMI